uniref:Uncharacterized protein n=1 Tax=Chromera velia CCMP2878 TaxID=1169474 RepID=A0A0G4HGE0_9ALVE|eukprot:Cvel_6761.t1-p1 / transcript=Cvel_6761.t1 / gene=Cvel_6761 / organism=Chromera_velia_CCMP2878 / gene_product=hypothetical protein / transcript_product=hypothetical protein / location=Cvel_scaffold339:48942-49163(-) / protein_length=74 / sequence_SO=supercontig / SO=protein_coding / is_pseudo=false
MGRRSSFVRPYVGSISSSPDIVRSLRSGMEALPFALPPYLTSLFTLMDGLATSCPDTPKSRPEMGYNPPASTPA